MTTDSNYNSKILLVSIFGLCGKTSCKIRNSPKLDTITWPISTIFREKQIQQLLGWQQQYYKEKSYNKGYYSTNSDCLQRKQNTAITWPTLVILYVFLQ